jgi:roadblock/LC7 domain-containing protein
MKPWNSFSYIEPYLSLRRIGMATLDQLMALPGAMAAFEFRGSGELLDHKIANPDGTLDSGVLDLVAHMCAANMSIATMQARGWESMTDMKGFYPVRQVAMVGFDWSVVVSGLEREVKKTAGELTLPPFSGIVLANEIADYEAAFELLES